MYDVCITEDFAFRAEVDEQYQVNLHLNVYNWNPRTARLMADLFEDAKEAFKLEGFKYLYTVTPRPKFVRMVTSGGVSLGTRKNELGICEIIAWDLEA